MARRQKKRSQRTLDKGAEARRVARNSGLKPPETKIIPDKRKRPEKHKGRLLDESIE